MAQDGSVDVIGPPSSLSRHHTEHVEVSPMLHHGYSGASSLPFPNLARIREMIAVLPMAMRTDLPSSLGIPLTDGPFPMHCLVPSSSTQAQQVSAIKLY